MADFPPAGMIEGEDSKYFSVGLRDNTVSATMEDGYEVSRPRGTRRPRPTYTTGFTDIDSADRQLIESFWDDVGAGTANLFTWADPTTGLEKTVRFAEKPTFKYTGIGGTHRWDVEIKLKEV